jgi:hypothetical protein
MDSITSLTGETIDGRPQSRTRAALNDTLQHLVDNKNILANALPLDGAWINGQVRLAGARANEWFIIYTNDISGTSAGKPYWQCISYNMVTNQWSKEADMSVDRGTYWTTAIDTSTGDVYTFGGDSSTQIERYDVVTRTWHKIPLPFVQPRLAPIAIYIPRWSGFIIGGGKYTGYNGHHSDALQLEFFSTITLTLMYIPLDVWALPQEGGSMIDAPSAIPLIPTSFQLLDSEIFHDLVDNGNGSDGKDSESGSGRGSVLLLLSTTANVYRNVSGYGIDISSFNTIWDVMTSQPSSAGATAAATLPESTLLRWKSLPALSHVGDLRWAMVSSY